MRKTQNDYITTNKKLHMSFDESLRTYNTQMTSGMRCSREVENGDIIQFLKESKSLVFNLRAIENQCMSLTGEWHDPI